MEIIESLKAIRARLSQATSSVAGGIEEFRARLKRSREELKTLKTSLAPRDEMATRIRELVETHGDEFLKREGSFIVSRLGNPTKRATVPWISKNGEIPWAVLCAADPDAAVAMLVRLVERVEYSAGPAISDRPALIAKLEAEIAELERAEEALVDEAAAAGIVIEHRLEVRQRREGEARKAQLEAQAIADRAERQEALNRAHRAGSRVGPSQYLSGR